MLGPEGRAGRGLRSPLPSRAAERQSGVALCWPTRALLPLVTGPLASRLQSLLSFYLLCLVLFLFLRPDLTIPPQYIFSLFSFKIFIVFYLFIYHVSSRLSFRHMGPGYQLQVATLGGKSPFPNPLTSSCSQFSKHIKKVSGAICIKCHFVPLFSFTLQKQANLSCQIILSAPECLPQHNRAGGRTAQAEGKPCTQCHVCHSRSLS